LNTIFQLNPEKQKKAPAEGYDSTSLLFKQAKASEFIMGTNPIHILNNCHEITLDEPRILKHKKTTQGLFMNNFDRFFYISD
jgi:hypothetical protein